MTDKIAVTRTSMLTGVTRTWELPVTEEQLERYWSGNGLIQNIFPLLTPNEREFIKTGITPGEWDSVFSDEE